MKFYRYLRPQFFDNTRLELSTGSFGGVCLRFESFKDSNDLWVTHSRCDINSPFSRVASKRIADERAGRLLHAGLVNDGFCGKFKFSQNTLQLFSKVTLWADDLNLDCSDPVHWYYQCEVKQLSSAIKTILTTNARAENEASLWKSCISALNVKEQYASKNG